MHCGQARRPWDTGARGDGLRMIADWASEAANHGHDGGRVRGCQGWLHPGRKSTRRRRTVMLIPRSVKGRFSIPPRPIKLLP
jgi:hypothetical protein